MAERSADLAVDRLAGDWLAAPLQQLIRAAGLLHPDQPLLGEHVSPSEGFALMELAGGAPLTQRDLTQRLDLEKSTVSRLVAGLERRGLVSRRRDPGNRRFTKVAITDHGLAVVNHLADAMLERHARLFAIMTPAEREALATGLHALVRALHHVPPPADPSPAPARRDHGR